MVSTSFFFFFFFCFIVLLETLVLFTSVLHFLLINYSFTIQKGYRVGDHENIKIISNTLFFLHSISMKGYKLLVHIYTQRVRRERN